MKSPLLLGGAAAAIVLSSCVSSPSKVNEHWSSESVAPRVARFMLGYDPDTDGTYKDYQWDNKLHIAKTVQRHFLNWNPDNPNQPDDPDYYAERPVHSPLPNPINYFHFESLVMGAVLMGATGTFIPVPVDSIIGTLEPGGGDEFVSGLSMTFEPMRVLTVSFMDDFLKLPPAEGQETSAAVNAHTTPRK
jgi:hypothetical protein